MRQRHRRKKRFSSQAALAIVCLLIGAGPAAAANRSAKEREARKACLSGAYAKGVTILSDLFVSFKEDIYIFNQGRCFEQNLRYEEAIGRFQEYLRAGKKLSREEQADAQKHIADCKDMLAQERAGAAVQPVPPSVPTASLTPEPAPTPATAAPVVVQPDAQPQQVTNGAGLRTAGIVVAAAGGVALATGVLFNIKANSTVADMESTVDTYRKKNSDHGTYVTLAWVGYGVGAACVVTGAILYGIGLKTKSSSSAANVALVPTVGPGQAGAAFLGAF